MPAAAVPALSLSEWLVLCLICENPTHGHAITGLFGPSGGLGQVWRVHKAVVYRSMERLESAGLVRALGDQPSSKGPVRSLVEATGAGQAAARAWLSKPVTHARDIRSELLVKLALLDRAGTDSRELLLAQHEQLVPIAEALAERLGTATGFDRTVALWRHETITATLRFLDALPLHSP
jgi:DNA-binding PadR family transcriptional regulator